MRWSRSSVASCSPGRPPYALSRRARLSWPIQRRPRISATRPTQRHRLALADRPVPRSITCASIAGRSQSIEQCRHWLQPLLHQMNEFSIGQIHEICEGDAPHRPVGCPAQAWSVAEVLRLAVELGM